MRIPTFIVLQTIQLYLVPPCKLVHLVVLTMNLQCNQSLGKNFFFQFTSLFKEQEMGQILT